MSHIKDVINEVVATGDPYCIERDGVPMVVIIPIDLWYELTNQQEQPEKEANA